MIEIEDSKVEKMSDYAEKMLKYGGKLMQCIERSPRAEAAWDSVMITMTMTTSMTTWDSVADTAAMEIVADTAAMATVAVDTETVMAGTWDNAVEYREREDTQDTADCLTLRDGGQTSSRLI